MKLKIEPSGAEWNVDRISTGKFLGRVRWRTPWKLADRAKGDVLVFEASGNNWGWFEAEELSEIAEFMREK